ncbi:hypothetical protein KORDIASMS9_04169 [Kordia sp. SMS9]|nr:hypothetical protein KORDIASMS9_04169 [Kordia sp. SMS9]
MIRNHTTGLPYLTNIEVEKFISLGVYVLKEYVEK